MSTAAARPTPAAKIGEPTWEIAHLFPCQGDWTEEEYLALDGNYLIEFDDGVLEFLPMPTTSHQMMVSFFYEALKVFASPGGLGLTLVAPLRVRLWTRKFREPDVLFLLTRNLAKMGEDFWTGADLVMEVVSKTARDRERDLERKRVEYARAGIAEYWIVDPAEERITVLVLPEGAEVYAVRGEFRRGDVATSALLPGFGVLVAEVLDAPNRR